MLRLALDRWRERRRLERDIAEELQFHLEQLAAEACSQGLEARAALRQARHRLGAIRSIRRRCSRIVRAPESSPQRPAVQEPVHLSLMQVTGVALALTALLAFWLLPHRFRSLPVPDPDRVLVSETHVSSRMRNGQPVLQDPLAAVKDIAAFRRIARSIRVPSGAPQTITGLSVSSSFFSVLGVSPEQGRVFSESGGREMILSHDAAEDLFDTVTGVVGRVLLVDGEPVTVVAVMPRMFWFLYPGDGFWMTVPPSGRRVTATLVARLGAGVATAQAASELQEGLLRRLDGTTASFATLSDASAGHLRVGAWILGWWLAALGLLGTVQTWSLWQSLAGMAAGWHTLLRNYCFLALKALPPLAILTVCWVAALEWEIMAPLGYFSTVLIFVATFVYLHGCFAIIWWALIDQRLRCYLCLRRVRMPVYLGTVGSILFNLPGTEYICAHGHGTLYVPAPTSRGLKRTRWKSSEAFFEGLLQAPASRGS